MPDFKQHVAVASTTKAQPNSGATQRTARDIASILDPSLVGDSIRRVLHDVGSAVGVNSQPAAADGFDLLNAMQVGKTMAAMKAVIPIAGSSALAGEARYTLLQTLKRMLPEKLDYRGLPVALLIRGTSMHLSAMFWTLSKHQLKGTCLLA